MAVTIKLKRMRVGMPDDGRNISIVWEDRVNPLMDSDGVVIPSEDFNPTTGKYVPRYPEFAEMVTIPTDAQATQAYIDALIAPALENAKKRAQARANDMEAKELVRTFVRTLNQDSRVDFQGIVTLP